MDTSAPLVVVSPQVRDAFHEGCRAVFESPGSRWRGGALEGDLILRFAAHYERLVALPRHLKRVVQRQWKRSLSAIALLLALGAAPAWAATIEVTPGTPPGIKADGKCALVEAIVNANRNARTHLDCVAGSGAVDTILLPANSQQRLHDTQAIPAIASRIVIEGRGSTISRDIQARQAFINVSATGYLTLNETTVSGADGGVSWDAYGIVNTGRLELNDSHVVQTDGVINSGGVAVLNRSSITDSVGIYVDKGGAIQNRNAGSLTVTASVITGNSAEFRAGGIFNDTGSTANIIDSVVSDNRIGYEGSGGGIVNYGSLVLLGTTVAGNTADFAGGITNSGTATIRRSTISGNRQSHQYLYLNTGGISNSGTLTLANSTVSGNYSSGYRAGGIRNRGTLTVQSSTITGNELRDRPSVEEKGSGIYAERGTLTISRSIVSGNRSSSSPEVFVAPGAEVTADDYNLFGHDGDAGVSGFTPGSTDIVPNKPIGGILLPLADNGGDFNTRTHALAMNSPALDASPDDATCLAVDQRGSPRPRGPACDIGAFEGAAVLCNGKVSTQVGTDGPDELTGTSGVDVIAGLNGDDDIAGLGGNDLICAGGGADSVFGSSGNDVLFGQGGNDRLFGHAGNDTLNGGTGQDQCDGGTHTGAGDTAAACETVKNVP